MMSKHRVIVCCWLRGHETELAMNRKQEEALGVKISKLKAVCPTCRDAGVGNTPIFIKEGVTLFNPSKVFKCEHGHTSHIGPVSATMLHVCYGPDGMSFVNVEGRIDDLPELLDTKQIVCHHVGASGQVCGCSLSAVDDFKLSYVVAANIKTRTRLGDLWDRAGVEPVRPASYDGNGGVKESRTEKANRERLRNMRNRNVPVDRSPGRRIDKPTDRVYERRSKGEVNPDRLKGPQ